MKTAEDVLREYVVFNDLNGNEPVELLPLTIVDVMDEYLELFKEKMFEIAYDYDSSVSERMERIKELLNSK